MKYINIINLSVVALLSSFLTLSFAPQSESVQKKDQRSSLERVIEAGVLRCGYISYPPYFELDLQTGAPKGIMVDIMAAIGHKMEVQIEWTEETGWGSMIEGLRSDRFDAVCSSVWKNTARALHTRFSDPIGYSTIEAWVRADDQRFHALSEINTPDVSISVMDGEMTSMIASSSFPKAKTLSLPQTASFSDLLLNVVHKKADIVFLEEQIVQDFLKMHPNALRKAFPDTPVSAFPISIMMQKEANDLQTIINTALEEMLNSQQMEQIFLAYDEAVFKKRKRQF